MATLGVNTQFKMGDAAEPEVFTKVAGMTSIGSVGDEAPLVNVTTIDDTGKTYIAGNIDGQELELVGNYELSDSSQAAFRNAAKARTAHNFQISYNNGVTANINLVLLGFKMNEPEGESALTFTVKAKQNGTTTWADQL